jgi:hypothetical protein
MEITSEKLAELKTKLILYRKLYVLHFITTKYGYETVYKNVIGS